MTISRTHFIMFATAILATVVVFFALADVARGRVVANGYNLDVIVADTFLERRNGLSGFTSDNLGADGMLFVFDDALVRDFWMKGMKFPLDVIWLKDGKIVDVEYDVPAPEDGEEPETMTSSPIPVDMVLELPAGKASELGIVSGMKLEVLLDE